MLCLAPAAVTDGWFFFFLLFEFLLPGTVQHPIAYPTVARVRCSSLSSELRGIWLGAAYLVGQPERLADAHRLEAAAAVQRVV